MKWIFFGRHQEYITANYKADGVKPALFIRRYLKKEVEPGKLKQIKLNTVEKTEKKAKKPAARKAENPAAKKTVKTTTVKKI